MGRLVLPNRVTQQPQYTAPLDAQGLGKGFQLLINPALGPVDLVTGRVWTPSGNARISAGLHGKSLDFDGVDDFYTYTGYPEISGNVGSVVFWFPRVGVADTFGHILLSDNGGIYLQVANLSSVFFGGTQNASGSIPSWFSTSNRSLVFSSDGTAAGTKLYLDGVDTGMAWSTPPGSHSASSKTFNIGNYTGGASWDFDGSMLVVGKTTQVWGAAEARAFHESKGNALYKATARRLLSQAATGTVALTGQALAGSQGTLTPSTSVALTGQSITSSQGTLAPGTAKALTGQSLTSAQGTLSPSTSVALTGQSTSSAQGTLTPAIGGVVTLTGQSATSSQGTLTPSTTVALTGQSLTSGQGTLTPATGVVVALTGKAATLAQGTLTPTITIALTGQSLTAAQGSLSLDQYIWDTTQGRAQPGRGTFKPLKPNEMSKPEIVVVDIPEEESTYEHHPVSDVKPIKLGPRAGITGIKLPPRRHPGATPAPVQNRDYKALMARAGTKTKTMKLSDFPVKQNKKYLTKTRGPVTLKGN